MKLVTRLNFFVVFCVSVPLTGAAQSSCISIEDDQQRLSCYDIENGRTETTTETVDLGKWSKKSDVSPLTDEKNVFLTLLSENDLRARFGQPGPAALYLRCRENTTSVYFVFNGHFMSDIQGRGRVEYRVDGNPMSAVNTSASTDNEALGLWSGNQAIPFIKKLIGGEQLVVRATPHSESAMTATFDIRGIDNAIVEVRETCSW